MPDKFLQELENYCLQGDFTDQEKLSKYADEYATRCINYNDACERVREYLDRGLVNEARQLYLQSEPPLEQQFQSLQFSCVSDFINCLSIYGFNTPPTIDKTVIERLKMEFTKNRELQPIINKFRSIVKTDRLTEKTELARQILEITPDKGVWQKTVRDLENELTQNLSANMKNAADNHDYQFLLQAQTALSSSDWVNPPPFELIDSVNAYIEQERLYRLNNLAEKQANEIDNIYREDPSGRHAELGNALASWDRILESNSFTPKPELIALIQPARENWKQVEKEINDEKNYQMFIHELVSGITSQSLSLEKLDEISFQLTNLNRSIPTEMQPLFQTYREALLLKQKKKKLLINSIIIITILFAIGCGIFAFIRFTDNRLAQEYAQKLHESIEDASLPAEKTEEIFNEIESKYPQLLNIAVFKTYRGKLSEKKELQLKNANRFDALVLEMTESLNSYSENKEKLKAALDELTSLQFTDEQRARYSEIFQKYDAAKIAYIDHQDKEYRKLLAKLNSQYNDIELLLERGDQSEARNISDSILTDLNVLNDIPDVTEKIKLDSTALCTKLANAPQKIKQYSIDKEFSNKLEAWKKRFDILNSQFPTDFNLGINQETYSRWKKLKSVQVSPEWFTSNRANPSPSSIDGNSIIQFIDCLEQDYEKLKANDTPSPSLKLQRSELQSDIEKLARIRRNISIYLISLDKKVETVFSTSDSDMWEEEISSFLNLIPACHTSSTMNDFLNSQWNKRNDFNYPSFFPEQKSELDAMLQLRQKLRETFKEYIVSLSSDTSKNPLYSFAFNAPDKGYSNFFEFYYNDYCLSKLSTIKYKGSNAKQLPVLPDNYHLTIWESPHSEKKIYAARGFVYKSVEYKVFSDSSTNNLVNLKFQVPHQSWTINCLKKLEQQDNNTPFDALKMLYTDLCTRRGKNGDIVFKRDAYMRVKIIYTACELLKETMRKEKRQLRQIEKLIDTETENINEILALLKPVLNDLPNSIKDSWMNLSYSKPDSYSELVNSLIKIKSNLSMTIDDEIKQREEFFQKKPEPCGVLMIKYQPSPAPPLKSFIPMPDKKDKITEDLYTISEHTLSTIGKGLSLHNFLVLARHDGTIEYRLVFSILD